MTFDRDSASRRAAAERDLVGSGEHDARIEIVAYDPRWPGRFIAEATRLAQVLPAVTLHHVGSTAVPGLAAKPIIDLMAFVDDVDTPVPALIEAGYLYPAAYNATLIARRWLCRPSASRRTHHLHLVGDREELARCLRFRDTLRADRRLAGDYAALKLDLAARMPDDREGYTAAKTAFVLRGTPDRIDA